MADENNENNGTTGQKSAEASNKTQAEKPPASEQDSTPDTKLKKNEGKNEKDEGVEGETDEDKKAKAGTGTDSVPSTFTPLGLLASILSFFGLSSLFSNSGSNSQNEGNDEEQVVQTNLPANNQPQQGAGMRGLNPENVEVAIGMSEEEKKEVAKITKTLIKEQEANRAVAAAILGGKGDDLKKTVQMYHAELDSNRDGKLDNTPAKKANDIDDTNKADITEILKGAGLGRNEIRQELSRVEKIVKAVHEEGKTLHNAGANTDGKEEGSGAKSPNTAASNTANENGKGGNRSGNATSSAKGR